MQFPTDSDLAAAIASPIASIQPLLEVDWSRNNGWNHAYSNQSRLVSSADVDFASIHSDLPADINTVVGSSSAVATIRLSGFDSLSGLTASALWSKYYVPSPLYATAKEGTPIRYSRIVQTKVGPRTIRQFTGWISEYVIDEETDTVTLTCSDVYDLQTALVSLPVWARGPDVSSSNSPGPSGKVSSMTCIDATWVYKYVLQAGGRSLWPMARPDAVVMWPCDGSLLPTVGEIGCALNVPMVQGQSALFGDTTLPFQPSGPYGLSPVIGGSGTTSDDVTMSFARASTPCYVPDRGSSDPNIVYLGFAGWVQSFGGGTVAGDPSIVTIYLGSTSSNSGYLQLQMFPTGAFTITLYESSLSGSSNAGVLRTYTYSSSGNTLPSGWHYLEARLTFTSSSIQPEVRIDGALVGPTSSPASLAGFKYYQNFSLEERSNQCALQIFQTSIQHMQIHYGNNTPVAVVGQKDPPYVTTGKTRPARTSMVTNFLTHIPDRVNTYAWDILKEAVEGELGVIITREDGSVWMLGRDDAYLYGWLSSVGGDFNQVVNQFIEQGMTLAWFSANPDLTPPGAAVDLSREKISGLQYNPSADTYRNAIGYHVDQTKAINDIVWSSNDPTQFYAVSGSTNLFKYVGLPSGTISISNHMIDVGITATANKPPLSQSSISAVQASFPTFAASAGWLATALWQPGQRNFWFGYGAGILSPGDVYIGAAAGADQANFQIGGWKYDNSDPFDEVYFRTSEVAARGYVLLDLGTNDWRQYPPKLRKIFDSLLRDTIAAVPVLHNLSVPVDPRRQLLDVVKLPPSKIVSGDVYAQVVGKRCSDTQDSAQDYIDVRVVAGPTSPAFWDYSKWDQGSWTL